MFYITLENRKNNKLLNISYLITLIIKKLQINEFKILIIFEKFLNYLILLKKILCWFINFKLTINIYHCLEFRFVKKSINKSRREYK